MNTVSDACSGYVDRVSASDRNSRRQRAYLSVFEFPFMYVSVCLFDDVGISYFDIIISGKKNPSDGTVTTFP